MPDAQPKPTAADVLREHQHRRVRWACACGFATYDGDLYRRLAALAQHQEDMLAAAGLLATAEHDAQVRAQALRDAASAYTPYEGGEAESMVTRTWLRARADRIAAREQP